ncbi:glycosyltransferase, partial [bacterium]|nr:glycosyltransferase [bacterium]
FQQILKDGDYDAVHDHQDYSSGWHFLLARSDQPPVRVTHVHNPSYQIRNNYGVTWGRRMTAEIGKRLVRRYATHITGTSRQIVTEHGFDEPRFQNMPRQALHCGFDPNRFNGDSDEARQSISSEFGWPEEARIMLFAGRTDPSPDLGHAQNHKNSGFAVNLAIAAAHRDPALRMVMCGAPSMATPILQARIDETGCGGRIVMAGIRKDIERFMLGSDLLLFPSRGEGLGMVAVEAQAAGLPVLASTAVPRECLVVDGMVQFLEVSDDFEPWLRCIEETFSGAKWDRRSCNSEVAASPFAIRNSAELLRELYSSHSVAP